MAKKPKIIKKSRSRRPSLRDLALKLGVSHTAVARALRNDKRVSDALRKKIQEAARAEGYITNELTQALITGKSQTVGVVVPTMYSSFVSRLVDCIVQELWRDGVIPFVLCSQLDQAIEERMLERLAARRVDGVIIMPSREDRGETHFAKLLDRHTPIVAVNNPLPRLNAPLIASNDELGAQQMTQHLIDQGHTHILHIASALDSEHADRRREQGYENSMKEAGLKPHVIYAPDRVASLSSTVAMLDAYFQTTAGRLITAVFCFNDHFGYCIYDFARRSGARIGKDLAVGGYGNIRSTPEYIPDAVDIIHPAMSTVEQHPQTVAKLAVERFFDMVQGKSIVSETLVEPKLIIRESTSFKL